MIHMCMSDVSDRRELSLLVLLSLILNRSDFRKWPKSNGHKSNGTNDQLENSVGIFNAQQTHTTRQHARVDPPAQRRSTHVDTHIYAISARR